MIDEETGLLKGWDAVEGLDGTKRYYPKGKINNLDFELSEEEYLKEVERRSTKITNIPQSKDNRLGTKLTKQVTAAAHNFAIDRPGITGVLSGAANFMSGVTEDLKRSATDPNEKDIGKRLIGSFIHIEDAVIDKSATGARMWATGSDLYNPFTEEKIGSLPDLNVDPTLATVVGAVSAGTVTGAFTDKGLDKVSKFKIPPNNLQPALVTNNTVLGQSVNTVLKNEDLVKTSFKYSDITEVPANVRTRRAAKIHFRNTEFIDEFSAKTKQLQDHFAKHGNLDNVDASVRKITAPNGEQYVWKGTAPKGQKGVYSWKAVSNIKEVTRSRRAAQALDQDTLRPLFKKIADTEDGIDPILEYEKYQRTNKKVVQKVQDAINLANKLPDGTKKPKSEWLSLEHIFDVNFYTRTKKDLVTSFAGKGADELDNLKVIPYTLNSLTGAENKKITIGDALVKAVRRGEFTDYDKSVSQFIYNNIGDAVNKFTDKDWKKFTDRVLKGEDGVTIQDILFDITSKNNYGTKIN